MSISFFKYICLFLCIGAFALSPVYADEMDEVPDEYLQEADAYFGKCSTDYVTKQYYNCACASSVLLRERILLGPTVPQTTIMGRVLGECFDAINTAGPIYDKCLRRVSHFKPGTDPEKYCECVANTYVEAMNLQKPSIKSETMVRYEVFANTRCMNPTTPLPPG